MTSWRKHFASLSKIASIFEGFGWRVHGMARDAPVIDDPLAWQARIDASDLSLNMRGAARFWNTVEQRLGRHIGVDGCPDTTCAVIDLGGGVGVELSVQEDWPFLVHRFVKMESEE